MTNRDLNKMHVNKFCYFSQPTNILPSTEQPHPTEVLKFTCSYSLRWLN